MNFDEFKNSIIIVRDEAKDSIIKKISSKLLNIKVITLSELKKNYYFDYTKEAVYEISKKYNCIVEVAEIYIQNLYYIQDIEEEKIRFLKSIRDYLDEKKLLKRNPLFRSYLKGKKIVLYNLENVDKFYKNIFDELRKYSEVCKYSEEREKSIKHIYKALNKDEEIAFVACSIVNLIKDGVDINRIKIANLKSDYYYVVKKTFKEFNIPIELENISSSNGTVLVQAFKKMFSSNMQGVLTELKTYVKDSDDENLYQSIVNVLNNYAWCNDYNDVRNMIFKDISNIKLKSRILKNAVRVIDFPDDFISDDEYVFLINFNQGVIPINAKDEEYLSDEIRGKLGINTSVDTNVGNIREIRKKIRETKNLIVTYSLYDLSSELYISNAYDESLFEYRDIIVDYTSSNSYNRLRLLSAKDEFKKFGTVTDDLIILSNHYLDEPYCSYDNKFKGIKAEKIRAFFDNKLTLSYTSMNRYYQCAFRYYLTYIMKVDKFEDTFQTTVGNIFHKILSECFVPNYDFNAAWNECLANTTYHMNAMELFFITNLKDELALIIETIKNQMDYSSLKKVLYEKEIIVPIDEKMNITFKGFIDKVLYDEFDGETIVAVIDYKTGNPSLKLENVVYGLDMQLPIYIYLLKNSNEIKNIRIGGFYLQNILNNISDRDKRIESLKLQGYTNSDLKIISKIDSSYENSKVIKGLKMTSNGFAAYSKILRDADMNTLSSLVGTKIREASDNILSGLFDINPKEIDGKNEGCKYCKFNIICHKSNADIVKLKSVNREDILGGAQNA